MSKRMIVLLIFLLSIDIIATLDAQAQLTIDSPAGSASKSIASSENDAVKILGIDSTAFPKIKVDLFIDKFCAIAGNLKEENFNVKENSTNVAIDKFYFTGNASGQKLDLAVVFDDTGSMQPEIDAMKSKVEGLTDTLKTSGINANYALVSFKDSVFVKTNWTDDPEVFKKQVNSLQAQGGNDEPEGSLDAIEAVLSMGFRSDAQKVILVITDAHAHYKDDSNTYDSNTFSKYTKEEIEKDLKGSGAIFIPISPTFDKTSTYVDLREVANDIQSMWIDINSADFTTILEQIQGILTGTYRTEYTSPDQNPAENRTVLVSVNSPGCLEGSASGSYITPGSIPAESQVTLSISGRIFNDSNGDGVNTYESGLEDWDVLLANPDGSSTTTKTDRNGYYIFTGLLPGTYGLAAVAHENWNSTVPAEGVQAVELVDTNESEIDFGFRVPLANQPPKITNLVAEPTSPQDAGTTITWTANATDPDGDPILYRFFLNDTPMTDWITDNRWSMSEDLGSYRIGVQVRDGKHAGPNEMDDWRSVDFEFLLQGSEIVSMHPTSDGGYILAGQSFDESQAWLAKIDTQLHEVWTKGFGEKWKNGARDENGTNWLSHSANAVLPIDDGYILVGSTYCQEPTNRDAWMIKTDQEGNEVWKRTFEGGDWNIANDVQLTSDKGYIIAGVANNNAWLVKTDLQGREIWSREFGGAEVDEAYAVKPTSDNGYVLAGDTASFGSGTKAWLIKTDANGNEIWNRTFSGASGGDGAISVQPTNDGGYALAGNSYYAANKSDFKPGSYDALLVQTGSTLLIKADPKHNSLGYVLANKSFFGSDSAGTWLIKTDANGNEVWKRSYSGRSTYVISLLLTSDGGYVLTDSDPARLIKTDANGNMLWYATIHNNDLISNFGTAAQQTSDGGYIMAIQQFVHFSYGGGGINGVILAKFDSRGNRSWLSGLL